MGQLHVRRFNDPIQSGYVKLLVQSSNGTQVGRPFVHSSHSLPPTTSSRPIVNRQLSNCARLRQA